MLFFFFFFNQEGSFTYSVRRILKQNAKWNKLFQLDYDTFIYSLPSPPPVYKQGLAQLCWIGILSVSQPLNLLWCGIRSTYPLLVLLCHDESYASCNHCTFIKVLWYLYEASLLAPCFLVHHGYLLSFSSLKVFSVLKSS